MKKYYCKNKNCGKEICKQTALHGKGRCASCAGIKRFQDPKEMEKFIKIMKQPKVRENIRKSHKGMSGKTHSEKTKQKMSKSHLNKKFSEQHKRKIGRALKGKKKKPFTKQHIENMKKAQLGKKRNPHTEETIKKMKQTWSRPEVKAKISGKNNVNYIHGQGYEPYTKDFKLLREEILERDNFKCQGCGLTQDEHIIKYKRNIEVHHIDHNRHNCKPENLITLCKQCNINANYNIDYYYAYYTYIIQNLIYV
jgi:hypothetical protein